MYGIFILINIYVSYESNKNIYGIENTVLFSNDRLIRYKLKIKDVGEWESERVVIPESLIIIAQRRYPMSPFEYMVIMDIFKVYDKEILLTFI